MPDVNRVFQVERFDQLREIVGVSIHVVAGPGLARSAVTATIMGDATVAAGCEEEHLVFPGVCTQWPAMTEDYGLSAAPVLIIDLNVAGIFFAHGNVWHSRSPFLGRFEFREMERKKSNAYATIFRAPGMSKSLTIMMY